MPDAQPADADLDFARTEFWARPPAARHEAFARLRALPSPPYFEAPASPFGTEERGYYALLRHADVTEASRNAGVFSSAAGVTNVLNLPAEFNEYFGSMINMDDPRHARLRRIVSRAFSPRMIEKFTGDVARTAACVVSDLLGTGPCDFVEHVSARLPLTIICDMMGIPGEHYDLVRKNTAIMLSGTDPEFGGEDTGRAFTQIMAAGQELAGLVTDLAQQREDQQREDRDRQGERADDLITALVTANVDGERLTDAELASFFIMLLAAGNETTRGAISHALVLLTSHPGQRALLTEDFEGRIGPAVEEIVRYASPVIWMRRTVTAGTTLSGLELHEGDKVLLFYQSANRDPAVFDEPDRFDITRSPNPHVGFGAAGPHFCLGAHLARLEISAMLRELLTRVPDIRAGEPDYLRSSMINGIKHLPCEF
jgi:cytochrome P450